MSKENRPILTENHCYKRLEPHQSYYTLSKEKDKNETKHDLQRRICLTNCMEQNPFREANRHSASQ
jgi:hypothetical protein